MTLVRRVVRTVLAVTGFVLYTWYEAVRLTPLVKSRKAARRKAALRRR